VARIAADSVDTLLRERPDLWAWPHIHPYSEWASKGDGLIVVETDFLDLLERLRARCGFPLPITSGYRSPVYNATRSTTGPHGPHTTARAADIAVHGERAFRLVEHALALGFTGIGLKQHGGWGGRFIHLDDLPPSETHPRPRVWSYA
jgi:hypothetical protein